MSRGPPAKNDPALLIHRCDMNDIDLRTRTAQMSLMQNMGTPLEPGHSTLLTPALLTKTVHDRVQRIIIDTLATSGTKAASIFSRIHIWSGGFQKSKMISALISPRRSLVSNVEVMNAPPCRLLFVSSASHFDVAPACKPLFSAMLLTAQHDCLTVLMPLCSLYLAQ